MLSLIWYLSDYKFRKSECVWHGERSAHLSSVCVVLLLVGVQEARQAEVCDLDVVGGFDEHVPRGQVSVHQPPLLQVHHAL